MKVLIVDDEVKAGEVLKLMLNVHVADIHEVKIASSGNEATSILVDYDPALVFLDIKMPGMSGFDWLASLDSRPFEVIFTTAYNQYAIQAIRYSAFDYLLKPIDAEDLHNAMTRFRTQPPDLNRSVDDLLYNVSQTDPGSFKLAIATTQGIHYLRPKNIIRCEADGNYTHFYMQSGKHVLASRPLGHYSSLLPKSDFIRCHKSHLVNRYFVESIADSKIYLSNGEHVEVSRRRLVTVKTLLASLHGDVNS
jgi:two-component system LytT family response regulator